MYDLRAIKLIACFFTTHKGKRKLDRQGSVNATMVTMVTMGGDLQPGSLADRLLTGLGQPQINP